jgi:hypothetical protein
MPDAISNLGGGGLSSPYLANLANSLNYASGCLMTLFGGPLINKSGIRYSCMIAALTMPLAGSSYYVNARYNVDWYLLLSQVTSAYVNLCLHGRQSNFVLASRGGYFWFPLCC